jgi:ribonucleotide monophosphatase NagD (HAD superfamily)
VTGKPEKNLFATLIERLGLLSPLVIGDSFQTDIAGARNAGLDSLLVLTGVSNRQMLETSETLPTYVAEDLRILLQEHAPEELG